MGNGDRECWGEGLKTRAVKETLTEKKGSEAKYFLKYNL